MGKPERARAGMTNPVGAVNGGGWAGLGTGGDRRHFREESKKGKSQPITDHMYAKWPFPAPQGLGRP